MSFIQKAAANAPEIFLFLSIALGTWLGRVRFRGFALGSTACILLVAVVLGQLGTISFPSVLRSILFALFVFTIGFKSGPEFFASLSFRTLNQVILALIIGGTGLALVLIFSFWLHLDTGTTAGLAAGALTQSSVIGTATGALSQLGLPESVLKQQQANIAAGYAVTYILGYILVLLYVPFVAPRLMGINLKEEATKLELELAGGNGEGKAAGKLVYRKFQARAYRITTCAGRSVGEIEKQIGSRVVIERIVRGGKDVEPKLDATLQDGDEILLAGPTAVIIAAKSVLGPEIEGEHLMRAVSGESVDVLVSSRDLHGLTLKEIADRVGDRARGVFLNALTRQGREVPISPATRIYIGDIMTLVGTSDDIKRVVPNVGQPLSARDRTDIGFMSIGLAIGLAVGLLSYTVGTVPLTLGGGGAALIAGLVCGWLHSRKPVAGAFPPAAQQTLIDIGLGGFIACIGLANGPAALAAIQAHGLMLVGIGIVVTLTPMIIGTLFAYHVLRINPVVICGALAGAMTVDAAVTGACEVAESQTPVLGVAVPYAVANVLLTMLGPIIVGIVAIG
jgi:putative transport protein